METYLVGLTGNISSGKSKVANYFKELGAEIIDLDKVVHNLYGNNLSLKWELYKEFGFGIFNYKFNVNRKKLGKIVFNEEAKMDNLGKTVWPYVRKEMGRLLRNKKGIVIVEAAMLYESGFDKNYDKNILVMLEEEQQVERLRKRDNLTREEALKKINLQDSQLEKRKKADYIICNLGDLTSLQRTVKQVWESLNKDFNTKRNIY